MTNVAQARRKMWRPDSDIGDGVFDVVLQIQYDSWLWRGWVGGTKPGPFPGPGQHPDAGKKFEDLDPGTLKVVAGNCEAVLLLYEYLNPEELDEMRELGRGILDGTHKGEQMREDLMYKVARIHHTFWVTNRELNGAAHLWQEPGYKDHWGHQLWDKGLEQRAKDADSIQARAHCRTLAALDDRTYDKIRAWAELNAAA